MIRPDITNDLTILDFYSRYVIHYITNPEIYKEEVSEPGSIDNLFYFVSKRSMPCIVTFRNYDFMKQREEFIYHYFIVNNVLREDLSIDEGESYDKFLPDEVKNTLIYNNVDDCIFSFLSSYIRREFLAEERYRKF